MSREDVKLALPELAARYSVVACAARLEWAFPREGYQTRSQVLSWGAGTKVPGAFALWGRRPEWAWSRVAVSGEVAPH